MEQARQRASSERVYEDMEPTMEWQKEPAADNLLIFVPGFRKEQLKVQVTSSRFLRVSGERLVNDNKWVRFKKEIPIASNYDTNDISAKFEKGALHVKHPKIIVQDIEPPQEKPQQPPLTEAPKPRQEKAAQHPKEASKTQQQKPLPPAKPPQEEVQQKPPVPKPPQKSPAEPLEQSKPAPALVPEKASIQEKNKQEIDSSKLEKPTSETQVEDASKVGVNKQKNGKNGGRRDSSNVLQKVIETEKKRDKIEQKDESKAMMGSTEAGKPVATAYPSTAKQENINMNDPGEAGRDKETADISKVAAENHKQAFGGLAMSLKNPRELMASILVALQIVLIGLYAMIMKAIRSIRKSEK